MRVMMRMGSVMRGGMKVLSVGCVVLRYYEIRL